ncbi:hypothetical protein DIS24_g11456 [Lasiodiplodia hormozganensis]|uniref:BTB domain-containing protein n=1 Tax=Lasiodiplodia hormozganensis TaxID=869390 RepID=A0AA40C134_9PEZI|nr:hypothetical protein DIS24_g11456 [Lasiodiplodia hormozganensis]
MPRYDEYDLPFSFAGSHEGQRELLGHLKNTCFSDKFSDMKVRLSNGEEINCHRVIVCARCQFFDNALKDNRFREGQTGVIDMPNDRPHAIKALLEFCYKGGYTVSSDLDLSDKLLFQVDVMNVAAIYKMETLENIPAGWVYSCLTNNWNAVIPILPDVYRILEHLDSPTRSKWSPYMLDTLLKGALDHIDPLIETETWEGLWNHARDFMEEMSRGMEEKWYRQDWHIDLAEKWLTKMLGAEALRVVQCPTRGCAIRKKGVIISGEPVWTCRSCQVKVRLD